MALQYDERFSNIILERLSPADCKKIRLRDVIAEKVDPSEYVTQEELEEKFKLSRYQITNYLKEISAKPIGILNNYDTSGRRSRGVGRHVYARGVIEEIEILTTSAIDIEDIKRQALAQLE